MASRPTASQPPPLPTAVRRTRRAPRRLTPATASTSQMVLAELLLTAAPRRRLLPLTSTVVATSTRPTATTAARLTPTPALLAQAPWQRPSPTATYVPSVPPAPAPRLTTRTVWRALLPTRLTAARQRQSPTPFRSPARLPTPPLTPPASTAARQPRTRLLSVSARPPLATLVLSSSPAASRAAATAVRLPATEC
jgi:hypothetical protein